MEDFVLFPEGASTIANNVDTIYFALIGLAGFFIVSIGSAALYFLVKYWHARDIDRSEPGKSNRKFEVLFVGVPLVLALGYFTWGASRYFRWADVPEDAIEINVVAQQWMWKIQHPQGPREIDALHVPVNQPVLLKLTSQDVIHSFFVPAFRIKRDVVPARYNSVWFEATKVGRYKLLCAEFCGTGHSRMRGEVVVMSKQDYDDWLDQGDAQDSLVAQGERIFSRAGCSGCHASEKIEQAPHLRGLWGSSVQLGSGESVVADEAYIRDSILLPSKHIVAGYEPIMPSFQGQLTEGEIFALIEYIKSLDEDNDDDRQ